MWRAWLLAFFVCITWLVLCLASEDYYELLGVSRDADERTIRRAFKKLAISKHPDKDLNNPNAHNNFIKINKAYEVLKDPDLRRRYDQHGEKGLDDNKNAGQKYESWNFYNEKFGIYDDDPEILTLSRQDFQQKVVDSGDFWFVNFYSTFCSHCHDLAPTWREFARKMDGILKIGAVNCAEDPHLCQSQNVMAYPSLVAYPDHLFFQGRRNVDSLMEFITAKLRVELIQVTSKNVDNLSNQWKPYAGRPWLIDFCDEMDNCFKEMDRRIVAHMLDKMVNVGTVMCHINNKDKLCDELRSEGLAFYPSGQINKQHEQEINTLDVKDVHQQVLQLLPDVPELDEQTYRSLLDTLKEPRGQDLLVLFVAKKSSANAELKKLGALLDSSTAFLQADCSALADGCEGLHLQSLPKLVYFRIDGHYLIHYGKSIGLGEARSFLARAQKSTMITLTESLFEEVKQRQTNAEITDIWLVDFFAPWCHPCLLSINELSNLPSELNGRRLRVGIIDCDTHKWLCQEQGVSSYPTTLLLSNRIDQRLIGFHSVSHVVDFVQEILNPSVVELQPAEFDNLVVQKHPEAIVVVDFFAPWCGPCQQLMPEFRKLARIMQEDGDLISFGSIDCDAHRHLCQVNGVNRYPTIRAYVNNAQYDYPANWWRNAESMRQWVQSFLPTNVEVLNDRRLNELMEVETQMPIVVDYFANWCQHCHIFAPIFDQASRVLGSQVLFGKIDCAEFPNACSRAGIDAYPTVKFYSAGRRTSNTGIRIHAQDAERLANVISRVLDQYSPEFDHKRDEL